MKNRVRLIAIGVILLSGLADDVHGDLHEIRFVVHPFDLQVCCAIGQTGLLIAIERKQNRATRAVADLDDVLLRCGASLPSSLGETQTQATGHSSQCTERRKSSGRIMPGMRCAIS